MKQVYSVMGMLAAMGIAQADIIESNANYTNATIVANNETVRFTYIDNNVDPETGQQSLTHTRFSQTKLTAQNMGNIEMENSMMLMNNSELKVDATSTAEFGGISLDNTSKIQNNGNITTDYIIIKGAEVTNTGTITGKEDNWELLQLSAGASFYNYGVVTNYTSLVGGSCFYAMDGSTMGDVDTGIFYGEPDDTSTLYIEGSVTMTGDLCVYEHSQIVFTLDSTLDMQNNTISIEDGQLVLKLDYDLDDTTSVYKKDFFLNYSVSEYSDDIVVTVIGTNNYSREMTLQELSVPEPTTATLSLLALAALTTRRRRK